MNNKSEPRTCLNVNVDAEFMRRLRRLCAHKDVLIGSWVKQVLSDLMKKEGF